MKIHPKKVVLLFLCSLIMASAQAQLSGVISVPSVSYPTLDSVIKTLNTQGVGTGGLVIKINADETAPIGGYQLGSALLNASLSATQPLLIKGNNKIITGQTGIGSRDGVFVLSGTDYVTLDSLRIIASGGSSEVQKIEWGIALLKRNTIAPYDGCQNVTLTNCTVKLNVSTGSTGIYIKHETAGSSAPLSGNGAIASDANSNIVIKKDSLSGSLRGIFIAGMDVNGCRDYNNIIGGANPLDGNHILIATAVYQPSYGIYATFDSVFTVQNNTLLLDTAQHTFSGGTIFGIYNGTIKGDQNFQNNLFDLSHNDQYNDTYGMYSGGPSSATATDGFNDTNAVFSFTGNTITGTNQHVYQGNLYCVKLTGLNARLVKVQNNTIRDLMWKPYGTGTAVSTSNVTCFEFSSGGADSVDFSNNTIYNVIKGTNFGMLSTHICQNIGGNGTKGLVFENNTIKNVKSYYVSGFNVASRVVDFSPNQLTKSRYNVMDSVYLYQSTGLGNIMSSKGFLSDVSYNVFKNITGLQGVGFSVKWAQSTQTPAIHHNTIDSINAKLGAFGTSVEFTSNGGSFYSNTIKNISNSSGNMQGILLRPNADTAYFNVYNNLITNFVKSALGAALYGGLLQGIICAEEGNINIYDNTISDLKADTNYTPYGLAYSGIILGYYSNYNIYASYRVYNNTIRLKSAGSSSGFDATGIYYSNNSPEVVFRNNIINVDCKPTGNGSVVALRRSFGTTGLPPANLSNATNNNIYYVPDTANAFFYAEGFSSGGSFKNAFRIGTDGGINGNCPSSYKTFMAPREGDSYVENNLVPAGAFGFYAPAGPSYAKSNGVLLSGLPAIGNDQAGMVRPLTPDVGALQFAGSPRDATPPAITLFTSALNFCNATQRITALIKDTSGVAQSAGRQPRLYYLKTTNANTFSVPNTAAGNGWKWVTPTAVSGDTFSFVPDYNLLFGGIYPGTRIAFFVIAQDSAGIPNVAFKNVAFGAGNCPAGVNLTNSLPLTVLPADSFTIQFASNSVMATGPVSFCKSGIAGGNLVANTVTLKAIVTPGIAYKWKRDGVLLAGETKDSLVVSTSGSYRVVLTNPAYGCQDSSVSTAVSITAGPSSRIAPFQTGYACATDSVRLVANSTAGLSYAWYRNDTLIAGATDSVYFAAGSGNYRVRTASGASCASLTDTPTVVTISALPLPAATISALTPTTFCNGDSVVLKASLGNAFLYQWLKNQVPVAGATDSVYTALVNGGYSVRTTAPNGCSRVSTPTVVTVNPLPAVTLTPIGSSPVCASDSIKLVAVSGGSGLNQYQWRLGGLAISGAADSVYFAGINSGAYSVTVTNSNGCTQVSLPFNLVVNPIPNATITHTTPLRFCTGNAVLLTVQTAPSTRLQWYKNGIAGLPADTGLQKTVTESGTYKIQATSGAGCSSFSNSVVTVVLAEPAVLVFHTGDTLFADPNNYPHYQWYKNGVLLAGATNTFYSAGSSGSYSVRVVDTNGCENTSRTYVFVPAGIGEVFEKRAIKLYPNPTSDLLMVSCGTAVDITVRDLLGRVVCTKTRTTIIDLGNLADGMYLVSLTDSKSRELLLTQKIMKWSR